MALKTSGLLSKVFKLKATVFPELKTLTPTLKDPSSISAELRRFLVKFFTFSKFSQVTLPEASRMKTKSISSWLHTCCPDEAEKIKVNRSDVREAGCDIMIADLLCNSSMNTKK